MPKSKFSQIEEEIFEFWKKNGVFEKSVDSRPENKSYVFYDGPPFATGLPHYGHILASTVKDVFPRYFTMKGYRVERRWGWDCHGLPIENIAEKELGIKTKKQIEEFGVEKFNEFCRSKVLEYAKEWKGTIERLGRWADMDNAYKTMDLDYMESVWWVFKDLFDKGLIYEGYRSMHVCPRCETTLSQSEVAEGYKEIKDLSVTAEFHLIDEPNTSILAWTTTPWTLIGNAALAVGADIDYVKIKKKDMGTGKSVKFILAKNRLGDIFGEDKYEIVEDFKGKSLEGKKYQPLFDFFKSKDKSWKIVVADFVTTEEGTGIVHIAPAFGEDDLRLSREKNLPFIQHVGMDGIIKPGYGEFSSLSVKPADDVRATDRKVIEYLKDHNLLFAEEEYSHSYPHCWRCETSLINYATSSWFVAVEKVKDRAIELAREINWMPKHIKEGRFGKWLEGARDWSVSRQRYWGSVIPIWVCANSPEHKIIIGSVKELEKLSGQKVEDLHKHVVDKLEFACDRCDGKMRRVPDVLDTWFDSGSMPYAQMHYPFENKKKFENNFPAQFIGEGIDQTRAWFYYLHILATAIMNKPAFKNVAVNGIILAEDGKKMSKRLKNYPDPSEVFESYGADALRFYLMSSVVMQADNLFFSERDLRETYNKVINLSYNILSFYEIYREEKTPAKTGISYDQSILDRWIVSRLNALVQSVSEDLEQYNTVSSCRAIREFVDDLSTWWVRRSRDRFKNESERTNCVGVLRNILRTYSQVVAPFMPFMAERIWQMSKDDNDEISVHLSNWPIYDRELINKDLEKDMALAREIVERAHAIRSEQSIKVRQPLASICWNKKFSASSDELTQIILNELNVEKSVPIQATDDNLEVSLETKIDNRLRKLGDLREVHRAIQQARKSAGLKQDELASVLFKSDDEPVIDFIEKNTKLLKESTNLKSLQLSELPKDGLEIELSCGRLHLAVEKQI